MAQPSTRTRSREQSVARAVQILDRFGRKATAAAVTSRRNATPLRPNIVLLGEVKRGKSSLSNALAGRRDLLPVDVDVCTSVPIHIVATDDPAREGVLRLIHPENPREVPLGELRAWATAGGSMVDDPETDLPTGVVVHLQGSPLPTASIIDTPGVGGLDEGAIRLALSAAQDAGVLVLVCDSSSPITAPEMDILKRAIGTVGAAVVAVTKTDKNLRRWRRIVEDDRRILRHHLGVDIPVFGVSSLRAMDAAALPAGPERDRVEAISGITELRTALDAYARRGSELRMLGGITTAIGGLTAVLRTIDDDIEIQQQGESLLPELEARQRELKEKREDAQDWEQYFQRDLTRARQDVANEIDQRLDDLKTRWTNSIKGQGLAVLSKRSQAFTAQIQADIRDEFQWATKRFLAELHRQCRGVFQDETIWAEIADGTLRSLSTTPAPDPRLGKKTEDLLDPSLVTMTIIGGNMLGPMVATAIPVAGWIVGGTWLAFNLGFRAMRGGRNQLLQWLRETLAAARVSSNRIVDTMLAHARTEIVVRHRRLIRREQEQIQKRIEHVKATHRADLAEKAKTLERLNKNRAIVEATITELRAHAARMSRVEAA